MVLVCAALVGCTAGNRFGSCVGVMDEKDPALIYELSYWNLAVGVLFSETLIIPAVVILKECECPVGRRNTEGVVRVP